VTGIAVFCGLAVFIWKSGGYQAPNGKLIGMFFLFMPEILSATIFLIVRGYITPKYHNVVLLFATEAPFVQRAIKAIKVAVFNALVHFGKVSYSAYVFSLFTHDFTSRVFSFIKPMGWISMILALILYFSVLTLFATLSFYAIEKPFLKMRRLYVRHA
jgi:peptidoglycan/LPS O-acetylase OafA/YrhL